MKKELTRLHIVSVAEHIKRHINAMYNAANAIESITTDNMGYWHLEAVSSYLERIVRSWGEIQQVLRDMLPNIEGLAQEEGEPLTPFLSVWSQGKRSSTKIFVRTIPDNTTLNQSVPVEYETDNLPGFFLQLKELLEDTKFAKLGVRFGGTRYLVSTQLTSLLEQNLLEEQ